MSLKIPIRCSHGAYADIYADADGNAVVDTETDAHAVVDADADAVVWC